MIEKKIVILSIDASEFELQNLSNDITNLGRSLGYEFILTNAANVESLPMKELLSILKNLERMK